jgi:hypothetical protein
MQIKLNFGVMAPFISTQIDSLNLGLKYDKEKVLSFEKLRTAMTELFFHNFVTESQLSVMHNKLMKKILAHLHEQGAKEQGK